jgi:hypothetical protein
MIKIKLAILAAALALTSSCSSPTHQVDPPASASPTASATPGPVSVVLPGSGTYSWALAGSRAGSRVEGSANASRTQGSIESVIKVWLAADSLRDRHDVPDLDLSSLAEMIGRSDDWLAQRTYEAQGGDKSVERLIEWCNLRHTTVVSGWWSRTRTTATDLVRLGWCINQGDAAGLRWTPWLLQRMQATKDAGDFGIVDGVRPGTLVASMNGWTDLGDHWQVNCLGIGPTWVLAVMANYPALRGLQHGASVCANVAKQLTAAGRI